VGVTMTLLAMLGVTPLEVRLPEADAAMAAFVAAVRTRDRRKVAALVCAGGRLHHLNTLERPYQRAVVDCRRAEDLDELIFGDDGFRDYVMMAGRRTWRRRSGLVYVPPYSTGDEIHVRWRREGERLVIDELAMPSG
jgi:hypothetical protein